MTPLRNQLIAAANPGGGWGYSADQASRVEPTCWALLVLAAEPAAGDVTAPAWRYLAHCQQPSGLLADRPDLPANIAFTGLAGLVFQHRRLPERAAAIQSLLSALIAHPGASGRQSPLLGQDNSLRGWPWLDGTFSWVEPTSWVLLALKRARSEHRAPSGVAARIDEADRMLLDRCCRDGGWNYGNPKVLGKDLPPYVHTSALALLALHDHRDDPRVARSLDYLQRQWAQERSAVALGLTALCFRRYGLPTDAVTEALTARQPLVAELGNLHALAVADYAGSSGPHDDAFAF